MYVLPVLYADRGTQKHHDIHSPGRVRTMLIELHVITAFSSPRNPIRKLIVIENGRNRLHYRQLEQSLHEPGCGRNTGNYPRFARPRSRVTAGRTQTCEPGPFHFTDNIAAVHAEATG
jgi:hypothetical protein